jgi:hypothetical protein
MKSHQNAIRNAKFAENVQIRLTNQKNSGTIVVNRCVKEGLTMLLEFSCSDHKSIKDPVLFSTVASKDTINEDSLYMYGSTRVLRTAVIYGANGSGKSNFVDAIQFVKNLVINSINHQPGQGILQKPHKLSGADAESKYAIQFVTNGIRYAFGFTLKHLLVIEEYLYYFPSGRQVKIYERDETGFTAGNKFKNRFETCRDVLKPNRLFLSCAANFSNVDEIATAFSFFRDELVIYRGLGTDNWMEYSMEQISTNPAMKKVVLSFLQSLGTGIKDIRVKIDKTNMQDSDLPPFLADEFKAMLLSNPVKKIDAKVVYSTFETDLMTEESVGVRKLFEMLCPFIDIIIRGKVLVCDELEASLHESILHGLVTLFRQIKSEKFAQLIFTTHDTSILDLDLFRRDQVWFTEISQDSRATELYSLAEIKNVRKGENVSKGYIMGKYGAIPMLNANLAQIISDAT